MITIYLNGECSKSKGALEILLDKEIEHEIRYYLIDLLTEDELRELLRKLNITAFELIRKGEPLFLEQFESQQLNNEGWIKVLVENPVLIERPIVVNGDKALITRPPERVLEMI